jgi:hypothetical protein
MENGAHSEFSGLCSVKGRMKIAKGRTRIRSGNRGFFGVYNKCSLNDCGVE